MSSNDRRPFVLKSVEPARVGQLSAIVDIAATDTQDPTDRLFAELEHRLDAGGIVPCGPRIAYLTPLGAGRVRYHAAVVVDGDTDLPENVEDEHLPAIPVAITVVCTGQTENADEDMRAMARWVYDNGYQYDMAGPLRTVYLTYSPDDPALTVTELQARLVPAVDGTCSR